MCAAIKEYGGRKVEIIRADEFKSWNKNKLDQKEFVKAMMGALEPFDIYVAHNGQRFDKPWINSVCLQYGLRPSLRFEKFIDPVALAWRHLRLARNSLSAVCDYFDIEETKTPIRFKYWLQSSHNGDRKAMGYIVDHCIQDVKVLHEVYHRLRCLIKNIDEKGSAF